VVCADFGFFSFLHFLFVAAHEFYILIAGTIKVHRHDPELGEFALDNEICTLGPFDCFGTLVLFVRAAGCVCSCILCFSNCHDCC